MPTNGYIIPGFLLDTERKFEVKRDAESLLDLVCRLQITTQVRKRVQTIVNMLFDQKEIDRSLVDIGVDVRRISQVNQQTIKDAWNILKSLEGQLQPSPTQTKQQHEAELVVQIFLLTVLG